jgi:hypothetical protein
MKIISKQLLFTLSLALIGNSAFGQYQEELKKIMVDLVVGKKITDEKILMSIPKTDNEMGIFYSYTEKDEKYNTAFYKLHNLILDQALKKNKNIFKSFLLMSDFVDGDFADIYFGDIKSLIRNDKKFFCETYSELPKEKLTRLKIDYNLNCK